MLSASSCSKYNPALYPSYDILNPGEAVRRNPIAIAVIKADGQIEMYKDTLVGPGNYFIVDEAFMMWVFELKEEVKKLKKLVK